MSVLRPHAAPSEGTDLRIVDGLGPYLRLDDGSTILDAASVSAPLGHRHPELVEAIHRAAETPSLGDGMNWFDCEEVAAELLTTAFAGEEWAAAVRFALSGSEANDLALSLAQSLTGRQALVARERSYHGAFGLGLATTLHPLYHGGLASRQRGWKASTACTVPVRQIPRPTHDRDLKVDDAGVALDGAAAVITDFGSGLVFPPPEYHDLIGRQAHAAGAIWIHDEVVTGLGRVGHWFAFQRGGARPDIVTLGKGVTGGAAPGGVVIASARVLAELGDYRWQTVSTARGHPLTLAAIRTTIRIVQREGLVSRAAQLGARLRPELEELARRHASVVAVDGEGLLWGIELRGAAHHGAAVWRGDGRDPQLSQIVVDAALRHGVLLSSYGALGVTVAPALVIQDNQVGQVVEAIDAALQVADRAMEA
jgi:4-aminobutyrate aminotransferase-like enzyme